MKKTEIINLVINAVAYLAPIILLSYRVYKLYVRLYELQSLFLDFIKGNNFKAYNSAKHYVATFDGKPNLSEYEVFRLENAKKTIEAFESDERHCLQN